MKTTVSKWGRSIGIRIPHDIAEHSNIKPGQELDISLVRGEIRVKIPRFTDSKLIAQITPINRHTEMHWGTPRGKEVW